MVHSKRVVKSLKIREGGLQMHHIILISVLNLLEYSMVQCLHIDIQDTAQALAGSDHGTSMRHRRGSVSFTAKGALSLRQLLEGAYPVFSKGRRYRNFHKEGDYITALKDFYSVKPTGVQKVTTKRGDTVLVGLVGDRKLRLVQNKPTLHDPVLDIIDYTGRKHEPWDKYIDRIVYIPKLP